MTTYGTRLVPNMDVSQPEKHPRNTKIPLDLGNVSLLSGNEELVFKHDISSVMLDTRKAEALVVQMLLNEAKVEVSLAASHGETAKVALAAAKAREAVVTAEVQLAASREKEARHRVNYFSRLWEIARQNVNDAELQVIQFEVEEERIGVKRKENNDHEDSTLMVTLD
ncbi:hypothetical protein C8F04DRAFT_1111454 [Mycena alexandri]|uniref:Uncharacterized protein n=1 Tax=Mycena alexandri TaxID=1745969 RepID=A0AAD6WTX0_9AGAR|nr:hypothetical protein C8F04DRAFT_1158056 [Mycena alexandri]KAJ7023406.1 hypothetical protein C8F04DRAFT_1134728 [Mycena alexandri]KAJ7031281.1 hypothetical protein C8F04DRAFT_1111454 [Mycena alexandri]